MLDGIEAGFVHADKDRPASFRDRLEAPFRKRTANTD
jgi:hypothetical protein